MSEWRTMRSAPKDGSDLILASAGQVVTVARWERWPTGKSGWYSHIENAFLVQRATHWMPLPLPPVQLPTKNTTRKRAAKKSK